MEKLKFVWLALGFFHESKRKPRKYPLSTVLFANSIMSSVVLFLLLLQSAGAIDCKVDEFRDWYKTPSFTKVQNQGCDNRNELGVTTGTTLAECKQKCVDNTDCISYEYQTNGERKCQLSNSCVFGSYSKSTIYFDLYYLTTAEQEKTKICTSCPTGKSTGQDPENRNFRLTGQTTEASCKATTSGTSSPSTTGSTVGTCSSSETKEVQTCINKYQDELKKLKKSEACATLKKVMKCYESCVCNDRASSDQLQKLQEYAGNGCSLVCGHPTANDNTAEAFSANMLGILPCCCIFGAIAVWQNRRRQQQRQLLQQRQRQAQQQQQVMMTQQSGTQQPVIIQSMQQQQQFGRQNSGNMTVPAVPQGQGNVVCVQAVSAVPISQQQQQQQGGMMNYGQPMQPMQPVQPMIYGQQQPGVGPPMVTPMVVTPVVMHQQGGYTGYAPQPVPVSVRAPSVSYK